MGKQVSGNLSMRKKMVLMSAYVRMYVRVSWREITQYFWVAKNPFAKQPELAQLYFWWNEQSSKRNLPSRTSSLLWSVADSVGTSIEFAAFAAVPTPNVAELVNLFLSTSMGFAVVRTHFPRKNTGV